MIYQRKSRLPVKKQQKLLEHFVAGTTARAAALLVDVPVNTAKLFYQRLRQLISSKQESFVLSGEVEADESYFGGVRKGKRGRGAAGKVPVFGFLKRGGKVYTAIIPDAKAATLIPIIRKRVTPDSIVYTDTYMMPFKTSRTLTSRRRPPRLAGGMTGSTWPHSSSVNSLG